MCLIYKFICKLDLLLIIVRRYKSADLLLKNRKTCSADHLEHQLLWYSCNNSYIKGKAQMHYAL